MTTLKTPQEVAQELFECTGMHNFDIPGATTVIAKDRQAIATLLCKLLEWEKGEEEYIVNATVVKSERDFVRNQALTKAQAIIRKTLEGKQE